MYPIQKIFSTTRYVCLAMRSPGKTLYLYFGRGKAYQGLTAGRILAPSKLRVHDVFLQLLRSEILNWKLESIRDFEARVDDQQGNQQGKRIGNLAILHLTLGPEEKELGLLWKDHQLYFAISDRNTLLKSWDGKRQPHDKGAGAGLEQVFLTTFLNNAQLITKQKSSSVIDLLIANEGADKLLTIEEQQLVGLFAKKKMKFLTKKHASIQSDLTQLQGLSSYEAVFALLPDDLCQKDAYALPGLKLKFTAGMNHFQRRDLVFQKVKRVRRGEGILQQRLLSVEKELADLERKWKEGKRPIGEAWPSHLIATPFWKLRPELIPAEDEELNESSSSSSSSFSIQKSGGNAPYLIGELGIKKIKYGVGKNAQSNDALRKEWGNKEDLWFHLEGLKGAHAVVKVTQISDLTMEEIQELAIKIAEVSQYAGTEVALIFTSLKNVKGVAGSPGKVTVKKQRTLKVFI